MNAFRATLGSLAALAVFLTADARAADAAEQSPAGAIKEGIFTRTFRLDPGLLRSLSVTARTTDSPEDILRAHLQTAGITFTDSSAQNLFYNDRTGVLMARATLEQLNVIERVLKELAMPQLQVRIETRVAEMKAADAKTVGLDWLPSDAEDDQLLVNVPPRLPSDTHTPPTAILTEAQFRIVMRALEQREGVDLLSMPTITTLSGRQARMTVEPAPSPAITVPPFTAPGKSMKATWSKNPTTVE